MEEVYLPWSDFMVHGVNQPLAFVDKIPNVQQWPIVDP